MMSTMPLKNAFITLFLLLYTLYFLSGMPLLAIVDSVAVLADL